MTLKGGRDHPRVGRFWIFMAVHTIEFSLEEVKFLINIVASNIEIIYALKMAATGIAFACRARPCLSIILPDIIYMLI